jgi:ribosomal protein S10
MRKSHYRYKLTIISASNRILNLYKEFLKRQLNRASVKHSFAYLPKRQRVFALFRSPHVFKRSLENFDFFRYRISCSIEKSISKPLFFFLILNKPKAIRIRFSLKTYIETRSDFLKALVRKPNYSDPFYKYPFSEGHKW